MPRIRFGKAVPQSGQGAGKKIGTHQEGRTIEAKVPLAQIRVEIQSDQVLVGMQRIIRIEIELIFIHAFAIVAEGEQPDQ